MKIAFRFEARSDTGLKRSKNDDSGYGGRFLAVVADGMGGHVGGDVASATTVLNLTPLDHPDFEDGTGGVYLADEIQSANLIINELAANDPQLAGMGTTCTALLIDGDCIELLILVTRVRIVCARVLMVSLSRFLLTIRLCSACSMRVVLPRRRRRTTRIRT